MKEKEIPKGYKKTEIGIIPEDWEVKKLGEIGVIKTGGTPSTSIKKFWNGNIIWVTPTDINERKEIRQTERKISEEGLKIVGELPPNTLLVTCIASIGKNAIIKERGACNQQINAIIPSKNYDTDFLYYLTENNSKKLLEKAGKTATPIISKKEFSQLLFAFPVTVEEQQSIANVLSDFDKLIESLDKLIKKKKNIKKGTMQLLLTGKKRLPGFTGEWVKKKLGDILKYEQPTKYIVKSTDYKEIGFIPVLTPGKTFILGYTNEHEGIYKDVPVIIFDDFTTASKYVNFPFKVKSSAMKLLKLKDEKNDLKYIFERMQIINYQISDGDHKRRWIAEFQNIEISIPPTLAEQQAIAKILSDMDAEIEALEKKKQKYEMMKKASMELLLTGKIRLKEYVKGVSI